MTRMESRAEGTGEIITEFDGEVALRASRSSMSSAVHGFGDHLPRTSPRLLFCTVSLLTNVRMRDMCPTQTACEIVEAWVAWESKSRSWCPRTYVTRK